MPPPQKGRYIFLTFAPAGEFRHFARFEGFRRRFDSLETALLDSSGKHAPDEQHLICVAHPKDPPGRLSH